MTPSTRSRLLLPALILCAGATPVLSTPPAPSALAPAPNTPAGMISRRALDRFSRILHLDATQTQAAATLHDGYTDTYKIAVREDRAASTAANSDDTPKDPAAQAKKSQELRQAHLARIETIESAFMADISALLTPDQLPLWPTVERARRRDQLLRGVISGENIDLIEMVESLHLPADAHAAMTEPLAAYEIDLDRALIEKARIIKEEDPFFGTGQISSASIMKRTTKSRVIGITIRDLNERHAKAVEFALPADKQATFREAFRNAEFPTVLAPTHASRLLDAAAKLPDLTEAERDAITRARSQYTKDVAAANEALIAAIRERETSGESVTVPTDQGTIIEVFRGAPDKNPVLTARKARWKLDSEVATRLESLLRPSQYESLPSAKDSAPAAMMSDDTSFMILRN